MEDDNMRVYYCKKCAWRIEVKPNEAIGNKCGNCGNQGLSFVDGNEKEVADFFKEQNQPRKELCPCCGGTGFKMVMTYEGNEEFNMMSSNPQKCKVCPKHCNVSDLKVIGDNIRECKDFAVRGKMALEQDMASLGIWECICGYRNRAKPDELSYKCSECGRTRKD